MKICVFGLWHLGSVTAACLANKGFEVVGFDRDEKVINDLQNSKAPVHEPGLNELIAKGLEAGNLSFASEVGEAVKNIDALWLTLDTPVDEDDKADVDYVADQLTSIMTKLPDGVAIIVSSQVPVGFTHDMEEAFLESCPGKNAKFAYSPENLRLGNALKIFENPDRIIIGVRTTEDQQTFNSIFAKITTKLEWMSTESAEMTKHAINSFLALSVTFANELACICEKVGANAKEVERGLKTEERIGPKAYLGPGAAFAGGTLARDAVFLSNIADDLNVKVDVINAIKTSNDNHKSWTQRTVVEYLGDLKGKVISVLGLTYKPGTDTLRRSLSVELCRWLSEQGAIVKAYDPQISKLPDNYDRWIELCHTMSSSLLNSECAIVATAWEQFKDEITPTLLEQMKQKIIVDASGFLEKSLQGKGNIVYSAVGRRTQ